jgi:hypothetical protein
MKYRGLAAGLLCLLAAAQAAPDREVTEDGLVRVPSSRKVGVYRAPGIDFARYRRLVIQPIAVSFKRDWERRNPEVSAAARERMQQEFARSFRDELVEELVERGGYPLAESADADVLRIDASIQELDYVAPDAGATPGKQTYVRSAGSMKLVVEFREAASGALIGRLIDYEKAREYEYTQPLQRADPVTIARESGHAFQNAARYTREALNVAKAEKQPGASPDNR